MENLLLFCNEIISWCKQHPLGATEILFMTGSAITVFLCRYKKFRDSIVGTALFICWIYKVYETTIGDRVSAPSDVLFNGVIFLVIFSAGGNIMSVVVIRHFIEKLKSLWLLIKRPFAFLKVK
ncbi:hypothetical protein [Providencia manganoxydans]|uniref:hypothetical protein n=1 Tax=Providencia manganoxydans TaxID=2923283 RepID=UPI0032DB6379